MNCEHLPHRVRFLHGALVRDQQEHAGYFRFLLPKTVEDKKFRKCDDFCFYLLSSSWNLFVVVVYYYYFSSHLLRQREQMKQVVEEKVRHQ